MKGATQHPADRYVVDAVMRACDLMEAFRLPGESLRLRDLALRTGMNKATAFRLLFTLERRGLIERCGPGQYRSRFRPLKRGRYRFGYADLNSASTFCQEVTASLVRAATEEDIELLVLDNRYSPKAVLRNIELLVKERVDLVIEFQIDERIAPLIASRFHEAGIPFIALGTPHPGATYYGADAYRAGSCGGRFLGKWARQNLEGPVEEVILVDLSRAGPLPRSRLSGILDGASEVLRPSTQFRVSWLEGDGLFGPSLEAMRKHLRTSHSERILVSAINDPSAVGALRALEEAGRAQSCAVLGHDASLVGRTELRRPLSRFIGSVAFFPERFGQDLIRLGLDILAQKQVPPAVFGRHHLITRENVNRFYPNDVLLTSVELDTVLLQSPRQTRFTGAQPPR